MHPVIIDLGVVTIYSYGLMMALGFLAAAYLSGLELSRKGYDGEAASSLVLWAAVGGIAGARLWVILDDWSAFVQHPLASIFSGAGFTWYGGLIGGFLAVTLGMRRHHLPWAPTVDAIAPGLALAHGIGRIGCQLAGDGDWGTVTTLPWGMAYPQAIVGWSYAPGVVVHPTPLYEAAAYALIAGILWAVRKRELRAGTLFWWYLVLAPGARFFVEFVRINPPVLAGLTEAQITSLILVAAGSFQLLRGRRLGWKSGAAAPAATQ